MARRLSFTPSPVSSKGRLDGTLVELRLIDGRWLSLEPVSPEWSGWYRPSVHRPVGCRASSVSVGPPSVGQEPNDIAVGEDNEEWYLGRFGEEIKQEFDQTLVHCYGYPNNGRQLFPQCTPLYNKFAGRMFADVLVGIPGPIPLRNIKIGRPQLQICCILEKLCDISAVLSSTT